MLEKIRKISLIAIILPLIGCDAVNDIYMDDIYQKVTDDSIAQYNLSVKGGDPIEICIYAGAVVGAYNQAQDEVNYLAWKRVQRFRCKKAGLPSP